VDSPSTMLSSGTSPLSPPRPQLTSAILRPDTRNTGTVRELAKKSELGVNALKAT
jgi:hypothetical protein